MTNWIISTKVELKLSYLNFQLEMLPPSTLLTGKLDYSLICAVSCYILLLDTTVRQLLNCTHTVVWILGLNFIKWL